MNSWLLAILLWPLSEPMPTETVVARAKGPNGEVVVTAGRLEKFARAHPERAPRDLAQELLVLELLAVEAAARGLDQNAEVRAAIAASSVPRLVKTVFEATHGEAAIPKEMLRKAYEQNKTFFVRPELVVADHIFVSQDKKRPQDPALDQEARRIAAELAEAALKTPPADREAFRALAESHSADAERFGLKVHAEVLPAFPRHGRMVESFSAAAFTLTRPGEISAPVESEFGHHVIRLHERTPAINQSFEDAEAELRKRVLPDFRRQAFREWTDALGDRYGTVMNVGPLEASESLAP